MDKQTASDGYQTATQSDNLKRFQGYYLDYLLRFDSIGSYAAAHGLTYETAKHRIDTGEKAHDQLVTSSTLAATGLAFF
jgi:hypothetical protein